MQTLFHVTFSTIKNNFVTTMKIQKRNTSEKYEYINKMKESVFFSLSKDENKYMLTCMVSERRTCIRSRTKPRQKAEKT